MVNTGWGERTKRGGLIDVFAGCGMTRYQCSSIYYRMVCWHAAFFGGGGQGGHKSSLHSELVSHRCVFGERLRLSQRDAGKFCFSPRQNWGQDSARRSNFTFSSSLENIKCGKTETCVLVHYAFTSRSVIWTQRRLFFFHRMLLFAHNQRIHIFKAVIY